MIDELEFAKRYLKVKSLDKEHNEWRWVRFDPSSSQNLVLRNLKKYNGGRHSFIGVRQEGMTTVLLIKAMYEILKPSLYQKNTICFMADTAKAEKDFKDKLFEMLDAFPMPIKLITNTYRQIGMEINGRRVDFILVRNLSDICGINCDWLLIDNASYFKNDKVKLREDVIAEFQAKNLHFSYLQVTTLEREYPVVQF